MPETVQQDDLSVDQKKIFYGPGTIQVMRNGATYELVTGQGWVLRKDADNLQLQQNQ